MMIMMRSVWLIYVNNKNYKKWTKTCVIDNTHSFKETVMIYTVPWTSKVTNTPGEQRSIPALVKTIWLFCSLVILPSLHQ